MTAPFASWEEARLIDRAVDLAVEGDPGALRCRERWSLWRSFIGRYATSRSPTPSARSALVTARCASYDEVRRRLGLRESDLAAWPDRGWRARLRDALEWAAMPPGILLNWLPYRLPAWIADRVTRTPDEPASYKVMGALLFFPDLVGVGGGAGLAPWAVRWAALAVAVAAPLSGLVFLRIHDLRRLRPLAVGASFAERAALRDTRAALRRQIRDVVNGAPGTPDRIGSPCPFPVVRAAVALLALGLLPACSVKGIAVNALGNALAEGGSSYARDDDPDLVWEAVPFGLKTVEGLLEEAPRHKGLLFAAASGFVQYGYGRVQQEADFVEPRDLARATELRTRARRLYLRALALRMARPGGGLPRACASGSARKGRPPWPARARSTSRCCTSRAWPGSPPSPCPRTTPS